MDDKLIEAEKAIENFRKQFRSIVYKKGQITDQNGLIRKYTMWDKHGSHANAIEAVMKEKDRLNAELNSKLQGRSYSDWLITSKTLSGLHSRLKNILESKRKAESNIINIMYEFDIKLVK